MSTGGTYTGDWVNGLRHGHGVLDIPNGVRYDGQWKDDKMHGQGVLVYANGTKYTGTFASGHRHGRGRLEYSTGFVYEGTFVQDKFHGHGRAVGGLESGVVYEGRWEQGNVCGMGVLTHDGGKTVQRIWPRKSFWHTLKGFYREQERIMEDQQARFDYLNRVHKELLVRLPWAQYCAPPSFLIVCVCVCVCVCHNS